MQPSIRKSRTVDYDIHPDGKTLALVRPVGDARGREITLVLNWLTELQRVKRQ